VAGVVVLTPGAACRLHPVLARGVVACRVAGVPVDPAVIEVMRAVEEVAGALDTFERARRASGTGSVPATDVDAIAEAGGPSKAMETSEVAEVLGVSSRRVRQLGAQGLGRKGPGGRHLFDRADVEDLAARRRPRT